MLVKKMDACCVRSSTDLSSMLQSWRCFRSQNLHIVVVVSILLCQASYDIDAFQFTSKTLQPSSGKLIRNTSILSRESFYTISSKYNEQIKLYPVLMTTDDDNGETQSDRDQKASADKVGKSKNKNSNKGQEGGVNIGSVIKINWSKRFGKKSNSDDDIKKMDRDRSNDDEKKKSKEKNGILGTMGKALKRITPNNKDEKKDDIIDPSIGVSVDEEILDPTFNSEVALAIEIKRQKALDNYQIGDKIPMEFLPPTLLPSAKEDEDPNVSVDIDKITSSLDDSVIYIEKQIQILKREIQKYSGEVIPTISEDEKRLLKLKRDLETKRKTVILDDQKQRKEIAAQMRADKEKARKAAARQKSLEKKLKKDSADAKLSIKKGRAKDTDLLETQELSNGEKDSGGLRKNISKTVDGVVNDAKSAISNAWKNVRNDKDEWITVCPKSRISPGEVFPVVAGGIDLLVIGSKDGTKIYCIANNCPHLGTPLETGMIERRKCGKSNSPSYSLSTDDDTKPMINDGFEDCIVCPLHRTAFSLDTGEVSGEWCPYPPVLGKVMGTVKTENKLPTFLMRTRGKNIQIKINSVID